VNSLRKDRRRTSVPLVVHLDRSAKAARFDIDGQRLILARRRMVRLGAGQVPTDPGLRSTTGIVRIFARQFWPPCRSTYLGQHRPRVARARDLVAASYSAELAKAIGPFYTQGIAEDTAALRHGAFRLEDYLTQSRAVATEQLAMLRHALGQYLAAASFFQHFLSIDQNSHML
jgi:hypothetical protein